MNDRERRIFRWSPEELVAAMKRGETVRAVLLTDTIPEDATVDGIRRVRLGSGEIAVEVLLHSRAWPPGTPWLLEPRWAAPPDPGEALRRARAALDARRALDDHLTGCEECDGFRRCTRGSDLGVASIRATNAARDALDAIAASERSRRT